MKIVENIVSASSFPSKEAIQATVSKLQQTKKYNFVAVKECGMLLLKAYINNDFIGYVRFDSYPSVTKQIVIDGECSEK